MALKMLADREKTGDKDRYNDILSLMMKARDEVHSGKAGEVGDDIGEGEDGFKFANAKKCYMTDQMVAKTLMQFFIDGYDTTGTQIAINFYYLAVHQDVQVGNTYQVIISLRLNLPVGRIVSSKRPKRWRPSAATNSPEKTSTT